MNRLRLSLARLSFVHTASTAALFLFGCTTPNGDDSTEATYSTGTTTTAISSTTTSSSASTGSGGAGGAGGGAPSSGLFVERFEITNASTGKGGATLPDYSTKIIAAAIQADAASAGCIDLRSAGFSGAGSTIVSESVIALLSAPLSDASHQAIATEICSLTPSGCEVTSTVTAQTLAESAIEQPTFGPDGFQTGSIYFPIDGHGSMPRMSNACVSGLYVDSWNHAANTPEAKAYLTAIGVDLASENLQVALDRKVGEDYMHVFSFGMIEP